MKLRRSLSMVLVVLIVALILPAAAMAAAVSVECAYTDTEVVCEAYADTTGTGGLRSAGVQLTTTNCTAVSAEKNTDVWFIGDSPPGFPYPNSPDLSDLKAPNLIVGQFDTASATTVNGTRVKMGSFIFSRDNAATPDITAGLAWGGGSFVSFVDAASGEPLDGTVPINTTVAERCDVDASGMINTFDFTVLRAMLRNGSNYVVYADCFDDGRLTTLDFTALRAKLR